MKAIVVELKNDFAAVLSDDGCVTTVKNNNYEVGQTIQLKKTGAHLYQLHKKICMLAASAAATVILATGTWAYASPYTYVSLDVNPSIVYTVNRFDRVLHIKAMNDDGKELLIGTDFVNKSISTAFSATIEQLTEAGYLNDEAENGIVITTSSENKEKAEELAADLKEIAVKHINEDGNSTEVEAFRVDSSLMDEAKELGVTPGKLNLVEKLKEAAVSSDSVNMEEWLDKSVSEIKKATKSYKALDKQDQTSANDTDSYSEDENSVSNTTVEKDNASKNHNTNDSSADNNNAGSSDKKVSSHKQDTAKKHETKAKKQENAPDHSDEHNDKASQTDKKHSDNNNTTSNNSFSGNNNDNLTTDKKDKIIDNGDDTTKEITDIPATVTCVPPSDSDFSEDKDLGEAGDKAKDPKETESKDNNSQSADTGSANGDSEKSEHMNSEK